MTESSPVGCAQNDGADGDKTDGKAAGAKARRDYNREYMRAWRERNREHYREYNRAYQKKTAMRRKRSQQERAARVGQKRCWYRCGRPATGTIERVDPRTWKTFTVPYCGYC